MKQGTRQQRGAALIMAMMTVALVTSMAGLALWQQWRSVAVETAQKTRTQALWVLTGAQDWARLILREDGRSGGPDHLGEPWAVPLEEARLSTFLAADKTVQDDDNVLPQAFLSGRITDLQGRLNVQNLVVDGQVSEPDLLAFAKLFSLLKLPPQELQQLIYNWRLTRSNTSNPNDEGVQSLLPLQAQRIEQLGWLGVSAASLARLQPFITLLPVRTPVNLNTAPAEVIYACIPSLTMAQAQRLVNQRQLMHFQSLTDVSKVVAETNGQLSDTRHGVKTRFFEIRGRLRQDQLVVEQRAVVQRDDLVVKVLWRQDGAPAQLPPPLQ